MLPFLYPTFSLITAHFQKVCKPGARVGARSIMGSFGGALGLVFNFVRLAK